MRNKDHFQALFHYFFMSLVPIKECKITEKNYNNMKNFFKCMGEDVNIITRKLRVFLFLFPTIPIAYKKYINYTISPREQE